MHRLTEFSLRSPWLTLGILLVITAGLGAGVPKVEQAYGFRVLVGDKHPAIKTLDELVSEFVGGYPVRIAWECGPGLPCESIFDETSLRMSSNLTMELSSSPAVRNVQSPTNAPLLIPSSNGFSIRRFAENGVLNADAEELSRRAVSDPLWRNNFVSADGTVGVILIQTKDNQSETSVEVFEHIRSALEKHESDGFSFHMVGDVPETVSGGRALADSTSSLIPYLIAVIAIILFALTRSWQQTLATLLTMGVSVAWTLGMMGWLEWPRDAILQVLLPVIVIVGVCDGLHLLTRYAHELFQSPLMPAQKALEVAAKYSGPPCAITTLTTAFAFLSFTASSLDTFVRFGFISAFGVLVCLALTFTLLPITVNLLSAKAERIKEADSPWRVVTSSIGAVAEKRSSILLIGSVILLAFYGAGWTKLRVDQNWMEGYGDEHTFVQAVRFMEERIGLSQTLEIMIDLPEETQIEHPSTLRYIEELSAQLSESHGLNSSKSVLDLIRRVNRLLHNDDPAHETTGKSSAANAEILELLSLEDSEVVGRWLSLDGSRLRISIEASEQSSNQRGIVLSSVSQNIASILPDSWGTSLSGEMAMSHHWARDVQATQLRSFPIAFGIVFVLVSIFLRSWKLGLAAMVPTLLPVVVVLGAMGWLGMSLDVARAMIAAVVIGIGVDDSIHLLAHYKSRRDRGDPPRTAMAAALQHTGRAIVTTSVALALGFLTLMMSAWQTVASFGFFVALAILGALVSSLLVLPALIFAFAPKDRTTSSFFSGTTPSPRPSEASVISHSSTLDRRN